MASWTYNAKAESFFKTLKKKDQPRRIYERHLQRQAPAFQPRLFAAYGVRGERDKLTDASKS